MSLKIFHLIFIAASALMCLVVAVWGLRGFFAGGGAGMLTLGVLCLALGVVLVFYGLKAWKKLQELPR